MRAPRRQQLLSVADAAAYAGVSTRTVRRWIAYGRLPGYRVGARLVKVDQAELDDLVIKQIPAAGQ